MSKILIIKSCMECNFHEWIGGKPRCTYPTMAVEPCSENDYCQYPRVFNDGTKPFLDGCPHADFKGE